MGVSDSGAAPPRPRARGGIRGARSRGRRARGAPRRSSAAAGRARAAACCAAEKWKKRSVTKPVPSAMPHEQRAAPAEHDLGQLDLAFDDGAIAVAQRADRHDARAVLVAQRQVEQHVLHGAQAERAERCGQRGPDAAQRRDRPLVRAARGRSSRSARLRGRGRSPPRRRRRAAAPPRRSRRAPGTAA